MATTPTATETYRPIILDSAADIDPLSNPVAVDRRGKNLREGMVLLDELGCPGALLDHRIPARRNSGTVAYLAHDLNDGRLFRLELHANEVFQVAAR